MDNYMVHTLVIDHLLGINAINPDIVVYSAFAKGHIEEERHNLLVADLHLYTTNTNRRTMTTVITTKPSTSKMLPPTDRSQLFPNNTFINRKIYRIPSN